MNVSTSRIAQSIGAMFALAICSCSSTSTSSSLLELSQSIRNGKNSSFSGSGSKGSLQWNKGPISQLDLTGVAFDSNKTATLISPRHVLMARHHQRPTGSTITFYDKSGRAHSSRLVAKKDAPGHLDLTVGLLEQPVSITPYKVLAAAPGQPRSLLLEPLAVTNRQGQVFIHSFFSTNKSYLRLARYPFIDPKWRLAGRLIVGDSGNPSFFWQDGELILAELHHFGGFGTGPFLGDPDVQKQINALMSDLGGNHQLKTKAYRPINPKGKPPYL